MKHKIFVVGLEIVEHPSYDLYGYKDKNLLQEETPNKKMIMYMSSWYFYNIYCKRHKEDDLEYLKKVPFVNGTFFCGVWGWSLPNSL